MPSDTERALIKAQLNAIGGKELATVVYLRLISMAGEIEALTKENELLRKERDALERRAG